MTIKINHTKVVTAPDALGDAGSGKALAADWNADLLIDPTSFAGDTDIRNGVDDFKLMKPKQIKDFVNLSQPLTPAEAAAGIDLSLGNAFVTLTADLTVGTLTGVVDKTYQITFKQNNTGGWLPTLPAGVSRNKLTKGDKNTQRTITLYCTGTNTFDIVNDTGWAASTLYINDDYVLARYFGIAPNLDSTLGFQDYINYIATTKRANLRRLLLQEVGGYFSDAMIFPGSADMQAVNGVTLGIDVPLISINGVGSWQTVINPNTQVNSEVFMRTGTGGVHELSFRNLTCKGNQSNTKQIGCLAQALIDKNLSWNGTEGTGGLLLGGVFDNAQFINFPGGDIVSRGGANGYRQPNQNIIFKGNICGGSRLAGNHNPSIMILDQHGQVVFEENTGASGTSDQNNAGSNLHIGRDLEWPSFASGTCTLAANVFTSTQSPNYIRSGLSFRFVPNGGAITLPTAAPALAQATEYFMQEVEEDKFALSDTIADACNGAGVKHTITAVGANWKLVPIWATAFNATTKVFTWAKRTFAVDGDAMEIIGINLPSGLSAGLAYYRPEGKSLYAGKFYATATLARNGVDGVDPTALNITTSGTLADWGLRFAGVNGTSCVNPINVKINGLFSTGNSQRAISLWGGTVNASVYSENTKAAVIAVGGDSELVINGEIADPTRTGVATTLVNPAALTAAYGAKIYTVAGCNIYSPTPNDVVNFKKEMKAGRVIETAPIRTTVPARTGNGIVKDISTYFPQVGASGTDTVNIGDEKYVALNTQPETIKWVTSKHGPGTIVYFKIFTASGKFVTFDNTGNFLFGGKPTATFRNGSTLAFRVTDPNAFISQGICKFEFLGVNVDYNDVKQSISWAAATNAGSINDNAGLYLNVAAATNSNTIVAPNNMLPDEIVTYDMLQDGPGGRVITPPIGYSGQFIGTASFATNIMTIVSTTSGKVEVGQEVVSAGVAAGTKIAYQITATTWALTTTPGTITTQAATTTEIGSGTVNQRNIVSYKNVGTYATPKCVRVGITGWFTP